MKKILTIFSFFYLTTCISYFGDFKKSQRFLKKGDCKKSYKHFFLTGWSENKRKFLEKASQICEKDAPQIGILFYKELLLHTNKAEDRLKIQKKLIRSSLKLKDHQQALFYYQKLFDKTKAQQKKISIKYKMAVSFFELKKYKQVLIEINEILKLNPPVEDTKAALLLKGRAFVAQGNSDKAIVLFKDQIDKIPELSNPFREYLAFVFEEKGKLKLAAQELEKISPQTVFLKNKIQKLQERIKNQGEISL